VADWTAITGIVVSGVVGPATGGFIAWHLAGRAQRHERELADLETARIVLDEAATHLRTALGYGGQLRGLYLTHGEFLGERAAPQLDQVYATFRAVELDRQRIELRFGADSPVTQAFKDTVDALLEAGSAAHTAAGDTRATWAKLKDTLAAAERAAPRFLQAAHAAVGARLESTR
jgi:hypothetical protein